MGNPVKILVPGSGVGRLAHEIAALGGFEVTANEWSAYMNVAYRYVTSAAVMGRGKFSSSFYPFVDWWSHQPTRKELYREIAFPDMDVSLSGGKRTGGGSNDGGDGGADSSVLLVEGDFTTTPFSTRNRRKKDSHGVKEEKREEGFDAIVTLFFIDTARNLMSYLETIHRLLKKPLATSSSGSNDNRGGNDAGGDGNGGHWINLGPLLYGSAPFLQFSLEEILQLSEAMGFEFFDIAQRNSSNNTDAVDEEKETATKAKWGELTLPDYKVRQKEAPYGFNDRALSKNAYWAQFWTARRVR